MPWFAPYLEPLLAVAAATLDQDGTFVAANAGFLRLVTTEGSQLIGSRASHFFLQPDFATLTRAGDGANGEIYQGLLTIGNFMGRARSLRVRIWRVDAEVRVLAEFDIEELEQLHCCPAIFLRAHGKGLS